MDLADAELARQLAHVYWLGGGSGAGKSTVAARLADEHGLRVYSTDDAMSDQRSLPSNTTSPRAAHRSRTSVIMAA